LINYIHNKIFFCLIQYSKKNLNYQIKFYFNNLVVLEIILIFKIVKPKI
jgi:hypothetical protein